MGVAANELIIKALLPEPRADVDATASYLEPMVDRCGPAFEKADHIGEIAGAGVACVLGGDLAAREKAAEVGRGATGRSGPVATRRSGPAPWRSGQGATRRSGQVAWRSGQGATRRPSGPRATAPGAMVVDQRVKVVGHHLKVEYLEAGRVGGVRLPGVAHGFAEFIENALVADDRAKGALVAGDL